MNRFHRAGTTFLLLILVAASRPAPAQQSLGSLTGTVSDTSGAVLPGAQVAIKNVATGLAKTATANGAGSYGASDLPVGTYTVTFSQASFQTEADSGVIVEAGRTTTLDAKLRPGAVTTSITVTATPLMNQTDTTTGYVVDQLTIQSTPLGTGSFT